MRERYDYLYTRDELYPWIERVKVVAQKANQTYVITHNHTRGQSLANAFGVAGRDRRTARAGPAKLIETYAR